jgi:hypothetical protein
MALVFLEKQTGTMCAFIWLNWKNVHLFSRTNSRPDSKLLPCYTQKIKDLNLSYYVHSCSTCLTAWIMFCSSPRGTFRSGCITRWRSLASTYQSAVLPPNATRQAFRSSLYLFQLKRVESRRRIKALRPNIKTWQVFMTKKVSCRHTFRVSQSHRFSIEFSNSMLKLTHSFFLVFWGCRVCWGSGPAHVGVSGPLCGLEEFLVNTASTRGSEENNH